jgi:hypothetical protein
MPTIGSSPCLRRSIARLSALRAQRKRFPLEMEVGQRDLRGFPARAQIVGIEPRFHVGQAIEQAAAGLGTSALLYVTA